jgi:4-hydroxythreonine-4-phosphate dehydrogenase
MVSSRPNRKIIITTGDADGIGWEVTAKALNALGPKKGVQFVYFKSARGPKKQPLLARKFKSLVVSSLNEALTLPFDSKTAIEVRSVKSPAHWVEDAAMACLHKKFAALVTAPLSKTTIADAGFTDIGHTEILSRVSGKHDLFMGFAGEKFCVVLATGHDPLLQAVGELHPERLRKAIKAALEMRQLLPAAKRKLPVAVVGVNPHAGEHGLIGSEEDWMSKLTAQFPEKDVAGPLVPDAAFLPQNWVRYSVYVCPYHDQGLIPFKMVHGFKGGVHLTLGLPFVRTSVDHGTAKELFGKNKAAFGSMKDALTMAIKLSASAGPAARPNEERSV